MTAPLDRIRVLFQTSSRQGVKLTVKDGIKYIYKNGGITSFWRGNGLNILKIAPQTMLKFYLYEAYRPIFSWKKTLKAGRKEGQLDPRLQVLKDISQGAVAGLMSQVFIFPIETLKTRVMSETQRGKFSLAKPLPPSATTSTLNTVLPSQTLSSSTPGLKSQIDKQLLKPKPKQTGLVKNIAKSMWKEGGVRPFFRGLTPAIASAIPYYLTDFTIYEQSKKLYIQTVNKHRKEGDKIKTAHPLYLFGSGMFSNAIAVGFVYPFALVRTRLQAQGTIGHPMIYKNSLDVIRKTYARESFRGFYNGIVPTLIKNVPSASISFVIYEFCKRAMNLE